MVIKWPCIHICKLLSDLKNFDFGGGQGIIPFISRSIHKTAESKKPFSPGARGIPDSNSESPSRKIVSTRKSKTESLTISILPAELYNSDLRVHHLRDDVTASLVNAASPWYRKIYKKALENGWDYGLDEVGPKMAAKYLKAEAAFILPTYRYTYMFAITVKKGGFQKMRMFKVQIQSK